jgi:hypothetical protein
MHFHSRLIIIGVFISQLMGTGTQFLTIPTSAIDLIYFNSPWRNPAALNQINKVPELGLTYGNWLSGVQSIGFKWRGEIRNNSNGLDINYVGLNNIELRSNKPTSQPLGYYSAYGISARGLTSWVRGPFRFGAAFQLINLQIYQDSSTGYAFDFGSSWSINKYIDFTISALNIGKMDKLKEVAPELPQRLLSSVSITQSKSSLYAALESNSMLKDPLFYFGANSQYKNLIFGGTVISSKETKSISGGLGFLIGVYTIRYGFQWGNQHLGMPQMLDLSIRLP